MKNPDKLSFNVGMTMVTVWMVIMFFVTDFDLEKTGGYSIGVIVGVIFSMFGVFAHKSFKNAFLIMSMSFLSSMVYDMVMKSIHYLN